MIDLVFWSFGMALTPVALGLAWKLIPVVGDMIGLRLSRAFEGARQAGASPPPGFPRLGLDTRPREDPCPGTGRCRAPNRRGPSWKWGCGPARQARHGDGAVPRRLSGRGISCREGLALGPLGIGEAGRNRAGGRLSGARRRRSAAGTRCTSRRSFARPSGRPSAASSGWPGSPPSCRSGRPSRPASPWAGRPARRSRRCPAS